MTIRTLHRYTPVWERETFVVEIPDGIPSHHWPAYIEDLETNMSFEELPEPMVYDTIVDPLPSPQPFWEIEIDS